MSKLNEGISNFCGREENASKKAVIIGAVRTPVACTGSRVLVTLLHEMKRRNSRYGLECICGGGGLGIAAIFERL